MATVSQKFIDGYLNNKVLEAIKPLNELHDALDPKEQRLIAKINGIIEQILSLEF
jgi:hypothetical protein